MARCHICDSTLSPEEIRFNRDHKDIDPCRRCLAVIHDLFQKSDLEDSTAEEFSVDTILELYSSGKFEELENS